MKILLILIAVITIAAIAAKATKAKQTEGGTEQYDDEPRFKYEPDGEWPFDSQPIMSQVEAALYMKLRKALPDHAIFSQVQLSQLLQVRKGHDYNKWFNRISRMSADFVIVDKKLSTIAVIELDDKSHNKPKRIEADQKKDKAITAAGINVVRWKVGKTPQISEIRDALNIEPL